MSWVSYNFLKWHTNPNRLSVSIDNLAAVENLVEALGISSIHDNMVYYREGSIFAILLR